MKNLALTPILLPTKDTSHLYFILNDKLEFQEHPLKDLNYGNQHLYLCSTLPIKEGQYGLRYDNVIVKVTEFTGDDERKALKTIEFTTDENLHWIDQQKVNHGVPVIDGNTKAIVKCESCNGQGYKDKNERDCLLCDGTGKIEVNFLEEYSKRYNLNKRDEQAINRLEKVWGDDKDGQYAELYKHHKDNQQGLNVNGLVNKYIERIIVDYPEKDKLHIDLMEFLNEVNQTLQSNAGGFSLEDMRTAIGMALRVASVSEKGFLITDTQERILQSLTKSQPKGDIIIECEMEKYNWHYLANEPDNGEWDYKIKLGGNGQPMLIFK